MDLTLIGSLAIAIIMLLIAHAIRAVRWGLLLPERYSQHRFDLLVGLALGYAANALVPFRIGEILRAATVTARIKTERKDQVLATVVASILVERLTDLPIAAGLLWICSRSYGAAVSLVLAAGLLAFVGVAIYARSEARKLIWVATLPFSHPVRLGIAHCTWEYGQAIVGRVWLRPHYLGATLIMWVCYLCAYSALGQAIHQDLGTTVDLFLANPLIPLLTQVADTSAPGFDIVAMSVVIVFALLPVAAILVLGAGELRRGVRAAIRALDRRLGDTRIQSLRLPDAILTTRERYREQSVYDAFLDDLFSGRRALATQFSLTLPETAIVHRFYNGGSDAITGLVEHDGRLQIAKFAVGAAVDKLREQVAWLERARTQGLSVTECGDPETVGEAARYEMPLVIPAHDFYDVIHTGQLEPASEMLTALIGRVDRHHDASHSVATRVDVETYLNAKGLQNQAVIVEFLADRLGTHFTLNGRRANISDLKPFSDFEWMRAQITRLDVADIHGDLTIDNVIATPTRDDGYYLIDPNPENLFNTPLIDWAKLMQSLHLGYESLNRLIPPTGRDGIVVPMIRSQRYADLHGLLERDLIDRIGEDGTREVYFHEMINYLRLTPYKIRHNPEKGLMFAGCCLILLQRYRERYAR